MGALVTNRKLFLYKVKDSDKCTFCDLCPEDEIHLFCECSNVQYYWRTLKEYIRENASAEVYNFLLWSNKDIIFSTVHNNASNVINFLVTVTKRAIYVARCANHLTSCDSLKYEYDQIFNMETNIAMRKGKMYKHAVKWSNIKVVERRDDNYIMQYLLNL